MTKMTHRINPAIVVKVVDLNISHIYNRNHMVGIDKKNSIGYNKFFFCCALNVINI